MALLGLPLSVGNSRGQRWLRDVLRCCLLGESWLHKEQPNCPVFDPRKTLGDHNNMFPRLVGVVVAIAACAAGFGFTFDARARESIGVGPVSRSVAAAKLPDLTKRYFTGMARKPEWSIQMGRSGGPVILIVVDALRPDRLSPYGFARKTSPNLGRLADDGVILTNYFVNGNWTRPTTASILTGMLPSRHGVQGHRDKLGRTVPTLPEALGNAGIPTGAVVGNGNAASPFGLHRGFDFYVDTVGNWDGLPDARQVVDGAMPFVHENANRDFFLMLFMVDPHDPYHAPGAYEDLFVEDKSVPLVRSPHWEIGEYSEAQVERMRSTYDGAVRYVDDVLGSFFAQLKDLGIYDRATIMVTSDHGEGFGEHGVFLHSHHFFDEILRAPMIIRAPEMSARGGYNHFLFQSIDVFPTVAELFGLLPDVDSQTQGVSIVSSLVGPERNDPHRFVVSEFNNFGIRRRAIRSYERKIILQDPADDAEFAATVGQRSLLPSVNFARSTLELFDLSADPFESVPLAAAKHLAKPRWQRLYQIIRDYGDAHGDLESLGEPRERVDKLDPETLSDLRAMGYIQ